MERAKNAMYEQAGRSHSWSRVYPVNENASVVMQSETAMMMPEPPVVELPVIERVAIESAAYETTIAPMSEFIKTKMDCQSLAMAYVEMQKWQELYETEHGFTCGTIFAELDLPFMGKGACKDE